MTDPAPPETSFAEDVARAMQAPAPSRGCVVLNVLANVLRGALDRALDDAALELATNGVSGVYMNRIAGLIAVRDAFDSRGGAARLEPVRYREVADQLLAIERELFGATDQHADPATPPNGASDE